MARTLGALTALGLALACAACERASGGPDRVIRFWALGREGEVVRELVPEFERRHPGVRVVVQQIPWTAAHEKLLTAFVGGTAPDAGQLGNTWIPEFAAIGALAPLDGRLASTPAVAPADYFEGIWQTNLFEGSAWGIPWYVDTRVLFYRPDLLSAAGFAAPPKSWGEWSAAMRKIRSASEGGFAILLPTNEWEQLTIF
jgi:multiple sugar transport system substrate-binding protein